MKFKIEAQNTFQSTYEVNALAEAAAINLVLSNDAKRFLVENKQFSTKIISINSNYIQTDIFYDDH